MSTLVAGLSLSHGQTWDGGGANNNWSTPANWNPDGTPANDGTAIVTFGGSTRPTPNVDTAWSVSRLLFGAGASSFDIGGTPSVTLMGTGGGGSATIVNSSSVLQTISTNLILGAAGVVDQTITASTGDLRLNGNIDGGTHRLILNGASGRTTRVTGNISGAGGSNGSINSSTAGFTLALAGNNTYTGATAILRGTLLLESNSALGSTSQVNLGNQTDGPATFLLMNGAFTTARNVVLLSKTTGNETITVGGNTADSSTFSGNVTLGSSARGRSLSTTAVSGGTVTFSGNLLTSGTDAGDTLTKIGAGTVILSGTGNTYKGTTTVSAGTLLINNAYAGAGADVTVSTGGRLGGTAAIDRNVIVDGGGTLLGGNGTVGTTLSINSNVSLADASVITLTLGSGLTHSTLARLGGTWTFDSDQGFSFINAGATTGTYTNLITGLAADPGVSGWTLLDPGWAGTFSYSGGNVSLNLTSVPVPEPSTIGLSTLGLGLLLFRKRRNVLA